MAWMPRRRGKDGDRRKRALIFIEDGSFSYDNRVMREADALLRDGWEVTVISPKYPDDPFFRRLGPRLRAYFYPKPTAESVAGHLVEHSASLAFGGLLTFWVYVRHGFSVFHACNPMDILWLLALPYRLAGVRMVFDQHDLCPELFQSREPGAGHGLLLRVLQWLERGAYRSADVVIATNESYRELAVRRGGKRPGDVYVVRNGPDLRKFRPVPPRPGLKRADQVLVGYLGNMNPQDGVEYLLEAAQLMVQRQRDDVRFVLIGGGSAQQRLRERAQRLGLQDRVLFTGRVPDAEMLATLCACDICVQPDPSNPLNDKSTMNKVLEYMALSKPVVAFDLKETRVSCGEAALYAQPNEPAALVDKILELADRPELRARMGAAGRRRIERSLAWDYSVPVLLAAYEHVRAGSRSLLQGALQDGPGP